MPSLEYRNKTWTWLDFINQVKKGTACLVTVLFGFKPKCHLIQSIIIMLLDAIRAVWANAPSLVREKFFTRNTVESDLRPSDVGGVPMTTSVSSQSNSGSGSDINAIVSATTSVVSEDQSQDTASTISVSKGIS